MLANAYYNLFVVVSNMCASRGHGPNIRLLPVSSGYFAGRYRDRIAMMGILAMGFAWRRLQLNDRAVLLRRRISLCCANNVSYEEHVAAFIAVR
eukprot:1980492-Alexandrium_andersonii.AAC.1